MQIHLLVEFVSLVETCSFQETAAQMNVSQSALTKHIQKMEDELGATLFIRSQHSVQVSEYGRVYYPYAKQIIQTQADAVAALKKLNDEGKNVLSIVFNPILGQYGLIDTITDFSNAYPDYHIQTFERYHTLELMKNHRCDFAFVDESELYDDRFRQLIYKTDRLAIAVPAEHPLAGRDFVTLDQLRGESFILHSGAMDTPPVETKKFLDLCASAGFQPNIAANSKYTSTVLRYVKAGRGIAVLNRMHIQHDLTGIRFIDFRPAVNSYIYLQYPKKLSSPCAADFLRYIIGKSDA
ncbi:MAG: LysR family transcriptional regulator [Faecousia sp.]